MEFVCRRCQRITTQTPCRVTTHDRGVVLLNMLVCPPCAELAKSLGLPVSKVKAARRAGKKKRVAGREGKPQKMQWRTPAR